LSLPNKGVVCLEDADAEVLAAADAGFLDVVVAMEKN
jgi:hypothetical protein